MQNFQDLTQGLPMDKIMQLANSPQGQAIFTQLQQSDPQALQSAMQDAQAGNFEQVKKTMSEFLSSPAGQALMQQMRGL
jgi:hypothetical protein